jgi:thiamine kinase-like enzyme
MVRSIQEMNDTVFELAAVISDIASQYHECMEMYKSGVRWVQENEDRTLEPVIPDNVLLFPTHGRLQ